MQNSDLSVIFRHIEHLGCKCPVKGAAGPVRAIADELQPRHSGETLRQAQEESRMCGMPDFRMQTAWFGHWIPAPELVEGRRNDGH